MDRCPGLPVLYGVRHVFLCLLACMCGMALEGADSVTHTADSLNKRLVGGMEADRDAPMQADAEQLDYDHVAGRLVGVGHVVITKGETRLTADRVEVDTETGEAVATGHVVLQRGDDQLTGESLHYNFKTGKVKLAGGDIHVEPFHVRAPITERRGDGTFEVKDSTITTCERGPGHEHYRMVARSLQILPDQSIVGRGVRVYARRVPVFYLPYWHYSPDHRYGLHFSPGYSSRDGVYLFSSYRHAAGKLTLEHHVDVRTERGVALGEDLLWQAPGGSGDLMLYYADDQEPLEKGEDPLLERVTNERYRIRLRHQQSLGERSYLSLKGTYLSDTDVEEDFFPGDYRQSAQPDNYATYLLRGDDYTFSLEARGRLNDYYTALSRMPEARLTLMQIPMGNGFYYESGMSAGFLRKEYAYDERDSYSAARWDWYNRVYYPRKLDGWLNVNPNAGYRLTWFSATRDEREWVVGVDSNGVDVVESELVDGPAELRTLLDLQADVSFKAFKYLDAARLRRHVVEPYATWQLVLDPTVDPEDLYAFDSIDALDGGHGVKLGLRNKLQRKWKGDPVTVVDADLFTFLDLDPDEGEDTLDSFGWDVRLLPVAMGGRDVRLRAYFDGVYDMGEGEVSQMSERLYLKALRRYELELEHRFSVDRNNLLLAEAEMNVSPRWDVGGFVRYEFDDSRFEEQGIFFQRHQDCLSTRVGFHYWPGYTRADGAEIEDEYKVLLEIWLRAFPEVRLRAKTGY
jgi:lipopolysaccharide export system protein LptA